MTKNNYLLIENYMKKCMSDAAHDQEHVYRVLFMALEIARFENDVNHDVLITASLLHDIGRDEQLKDPSVCHAKVGSEKAFCFLIENGFDENFANHVKSCILTHRYRKNTPPQTIEAKILFDADKIDAAGLCGIARTLLYKGNVQAPLYIVNDGKISKGDGVGEVSFFQEYKYKLENIYDRFFTERGRQIAAKRRKDAEIFYNNLYGEVSEFYESGNEMLFSMLEKD